MKPLISAILPTHNRAKTWLPSAIKTTIGQTYENWELIVVDDGSTDETKEVVESFKLPNIKYVKLDENTGYPSVARNIGICHSTGDLIAHTDDDSVAEPRKFELLVDAIMANPGIAVAYGDRYTHYTILHPRLLSSIEIPTTIQLRGLA
jgi:glycosyltransferase involved in cell wall biosynthesis